MRVAWVLLVMFYALSSYASEPKKLFFAPLPTQSEESVFQTFAPMVHYLEKTLHVSIQFHFSNSYEALLASIQNGDVDFAYLGPLPYVELKAATPLVEPLVFFKEANGQSTYTCVLVAWGDAYEPLVKLNPYHSFALTDPLSTCGYLSVSALLQEVGQDLGHQPFFYLGRHDEVALSIVKGRFDYGGVKSDIAQSYKHLGLEVVAQTEPIPSFALVANTQKLSAALRSSITKALMEAPASEYATWGKSIRHGTDVASDEAYMPVRVMKLERSVREQGVLK
jgi:phosphonate transport system substrate-binding protein